MAEMCTIVFTRYPEAGKVKTRLIPALGEEGAAALHKKMAEHTISLVRALQRLAPCDLEVWFVGGDLALMQGWLGEDLRYQLQPDGDLGDRMRLAFQSIFDRGYKRAAIVGTDCPDLTTDILAQSFDALEDNPIALGPAIDGGYYLIGLQYLIPELFTGITWSTDNVLQETIEIAENLDLIPILLPSLTDIDLPQDLEHLPIGFDWGLNRSDIVGLHD
jgi:uncharacterized protein